ncbi:hypothetical protein [Desulforegula conservatrix]|uniref:hypothetical protein n=1 Tax=Desulforegula conservatrix TaxID=153026 RepID=UPI0003FEED5C|nr:hypothetical protein [Desulforegula conservatrix]
MASKATRDMATAAGFAFEMGRQMKNYYLVNRPKVKQIHPLLDDLIATAEPVLVYFRNQLDLGDLKYISNKVDNFNSRAENRDMNGIVYVGLVIGQVSERVCELNERNGNPDKIAKLESILSPLQALYQYFEQRMKRPELEAQVSQLFTTWEEAKQDEAPRRMVAA